MFDNARVPFTAGLVALATLVGVLAAASPASAVSQATARPQTTAVTAPTITVSPLVAGKPTNMTIGLTLSAGGALAVGKSVVLSVPISGLGASYTGVVDHGSTKVASCVASTFPTVTCKLTAAVAAGAVLKVVLDDVVNPAAGAHHVTMHTSADTTSVSTASYTTTAAKSVSKPQVSVTLPAAGEGDYAITFSASAVGGLAKDLGSTVTVTLPAGSGLSTLSSSSALTYRGLKVGTCAAGSGTTVVCTVTSTVANGSPLAVSLIDVTDPADGSYTLTVSTSSDSVAKTSALFGIDAAIGKPSVVVSPSTAAGALAHYKITFKLSASGAMQPGDTSFVAINFPAGVELGALGATTVTDAGVLVGSCPDAVEESPAQSLLCSFTAAVAGGDQLVIDLNGVLNPPSGSQTLTMSTYADVKSVTSGSFSIVAAHKVSSPTVAISPTLAAAARASYTVGFTTSTTGALAANADSAITLAFPASTNLTALTGSAITAGGSTIGTCASITGTTATCRLTGTVAASTPVGVELDGVVSPPSAGTASISVSTTSDVLGSAATPTYTLAQPRAVLSPVTVVPTPVTAGAASSYAVSFTTSGIGALSPAAGSTVTLTFPASISAAAVSGGTLTDTSTGTTAGSCTEQSATSVVCTVTESIAAGDRVTATANGVVNPAQGPYTLQVATSSDTVAATSATFQVGPTPTLTLATSGTAIPGSVVTATVSGFAHTSALTVHYAGNAIGTTPANPTTTSSGTGTFTFVVPTCCTGTVAVDVTDASGNTAHATLPVQHYAPTLTATPATGTPGDHLTCSGTGWPPNESVNIYFGSTNVYNPTTDSTGAFSGPCTVAQVPITASAFTAHDSSSNSAVGTFTFKAGVAPNFPNASPGNTVTVTAQGFDANSPLTMALAGSPVTTTPASPVTNSNGTATFTFVVPTLSTGTKTFKITDAASVTASATLTIYTPTLTASPATGTPGDHLTCSGTGWPAGESVNIYFGAGTVGNAYNPTTDSTGAFSGPCTVTQVPITIANFHALDQHNSSATGTFTFKAGITANVTTASPGNTVTVTAEGFDANSPLTATFAGSAVATTPASPVTNSNGTVSFTFVVPSVSNGTKTVTVTDAASVTASTSVTIFAPTLTASPATGTPGDHLTCSGTGWPPNESVNIYFGSTNVYNPTTDSTGAFSGP
ncbi:hypothetical protein, partial [Jatrophihabitans sp.]|uniref:beta strand repeat-containing protein n=1 Tax=Jatrophihabitans sp. TaxID=1932789 RepID=UPI0030C7552C|nr:hypothetical protein [Jatrophihabitans sp.]